MTEAELEKTYRKYAKKLFRICLVFFKNEDTAAEMVQDIFCSLWERKEELIIDGNPEHYLYRCAKLKYYNYSRNQERKILHLKEYSLQQNLSDHSTDEAVAFSQMTEQLNSIVDRMPEKRKQIFKLSRQKGLTNKEIAYKLMISEKTVKNHLTKSLQQIRDGLLASGSHLIGLLLSITG